MFPRDFLAIGYRVFSFGTFLGFQFFLFFSLLVGCCVVLLKRFSRFSMFLC